MMTSVGSAFLCWLRGIRRALVMSQRGGGGERLFGIEAHRLASEKSVFQALAGMHGCDPLFPIHTPFVPVVQL